MKSLNIIQILFKIARVIALIAFIFSIIGAAGCLIGLIVMPSIKDVVVQDGKTIAELMAENGVEVGGVISAIALGLVGCGVSIFLAKYSELYFLKEIKAGSPFSKEQANEMRKYGMVFAIVSAASTVVIAIAYAVVHHFIPSVGRYESSISVGSIVYGLFFIILSLFCDYGAEKDAELANKESPEIEKKDE